jgi:hypothetical protein
MQQNPAEIWQPPIKLECHRPEDYNKNYVTTLKQHAYYYYYYYHHQQQQQHQQQQSVPIALKLMF